MESTLREWGTLRESSTSPKSIAEQRRIYSATSYDEHLVLIAGRNLLKALEMMEGRFPQLNLEIQDNAAIKHLRDMYEHWEDHQAPSFGIVVPQERVKKATRTKKEVEKLKAKPWSISYGPEGPVLGGVIPLREFLSRLEEVEAELLRLERNTWIGGCP